MVCPFCSGLPEKYKGQKEKSYKAAIGVEDLLQ